METAALKVNTNAMPKRIIPEVETRIQREIKSSNNVASNAKINALTEINH